MTRASEGRGSSQVEADVADGALVIPDPNTGEPMRFRKAKWKQISAAAKMPNEFATNVALIEATVADDDTMTLLGELDQDQVSEIAERVSRHFGTSQGK